MRVEYVDLHQGQVYVRFNYRYWSREMKTTYRPALAKPQVRMLAHDSSVSMTVENRLLSQFFQGIGDTVVS